MKTICTLAMVMLCSLGFAQVAPIDFEPTGNGASWTWNVFENAANAPLEIVANPDPTGINTSATVAKLVTDTAGKAWAGCESNKLADIGTFTFSASNSTIKMMVYKPVISDVGIKFATATGEALPEVKVANTKINQWEELTFDVSSLISLTRCQIIIFPDFQTRKTDNVCYFDNITFSAGSVVTLQEPTIAAPTPTVSADKVISLFSNAYTNVNINSWLAAWSVGTLTNVQIAGNDAKKYSLLNYVGIETPVANLINASTMDYFHVDAWTPNLTTFKVKLVDFGADGAFGGGDDKEQELSFVPTLNGWNSYDIKMSDFTGLTTKSHIAQLVFSGVPSGTGVVYIDNVYFYKSSVGINNLGISNFNIYPNPATNDLTVITGNSSSLSNIEILNSIGQTIYSSIIPKGQDRLNVDLTGYLTGTYFVKIQNAEAVVVKKFVKE